MWFPNSEAGNTVNWQFVTQVAENPTTWAEIAQSSSSTNTSISPSTQSNLRSTTATTVAPSVAPETPSTSPATASSGLSAGASAGIGIGAAAVALLAASLAVYLYRRPRPGGTEGQAGESIQQYVQGHERDPYEGQDGGRGWRRFGQGHGNTPAELDAS
jgi:hypothetical protein